MSKQAKVYDYPIFTFSNEIVTAYILITYIYKYRNNHFVCLM